MESQPDGYTRGKLLVTLCCDPVKKQADTHPQPRRITAHTHTEVMQRDGVDTT